MAKSSEWKPSVDALRIKYRRGGYLSPLVSLDTANAFSAMGAAGAYNRLADEMEAILTDRRLSPDTQRCARVVLARLATRITRQAAHKRVVTLAAQGEI